MRAWSVLLGVALVILLVGEAAAQSTTVQTPDCETTVQQTPEGRAQSNLYAPGTSARQSPGAEEGRGAQGIICPKRPPTYIAEDQAEVSNFSHFENIDGCLYVRPCIPSALQEVNNRQFAAQWHF
ncbi:MAG: hypothetical protein V2A77_07070 [Pseudomonadota bacterium]